MLKSRLQTQVTNLLDKLKRVLDNADIAVLVGYPSGLTHIETTHQINPKTGKDKKGTKQGGDLAELAEMLHYGTADIPARPFLEDGLIMNQERIRKVIVRELERLKTTGKANIDRIGVEAGGGIIDMVLNGGFYRESVPNSPLTIKIKGSDNPLVDGANMINSLRYAKIQNGKVLGIEPVKDKK